MDAVNLTKNNAVQFDDAIRLFLTGYAGVSVDIARDTPARVRRAYGEMIAGVSGGDAEAILSKRFKVRADQMVHRVGIRVVSTCEHHLLPFIGKAHFAYLPDGEVVGLSKISRLVHLFSRRLQVQERLTQEIVDTFQDIVKPAGCAINIRAYHFCEIVRGVRETSALTETTAFNGCFKKGPSRDEFLQSIDRTEVVFP